MTARHALAAIAIVAAASCLVHRKSSDFECSGDPDCDPDRTCDRGYCVVREGCPAACSDCDVAARTCTINCSSPAACGNVSCPSGYDCAINCTAAGACSDVTCSGASSCAITCSANNACRNVRCGGGACHVTCAGAGACRDVDCEDSCACDVGCAAGTCRSTTCPVGPTLSCTADGTTATTCASNTQPGCSTCP